PSGGERAGAPTGRRRHHRDGRGAHRRAPCGPDHGPHGRPRSLGPHGRPVSNVGPAGRGRDPGGGRAGGGSAVSEYVPPPGSAPTLPVPDLASVRSVHMIGVGGAGMRNLAKLLMARGIRVSGSDLKDSKGLRQLAEAGATVFVGHRPDQVGDPDAVIISSAILERNPELAEARRRGVPMWIRAQALAAAAVGKRAIAVSGTHGKTTTT